MGICLTHTWRGLGHGNLPLTHLVSPLVGMGICLTHTWRGLGPGDLPHTQMERTEGGLGMVCQPQQR